MRKLSLLIIGMLVMSVSIFAQEQNPMMQRIPIDPAIRTGKLANGMTYYISKNAKPKNAANFHIVTHVGAVQEEDNQIGLAHFLEHMAFNGIKTFPGNSMLTYLQSNGVEFGRNINASTGLNVTQYFLQDIPITKTEGILDTAMLILRDWSGNILLEEKEIDEERGVISEELRGGDTGAGKAQEAMMAAMGNGTRYSERNVIGTLEYLESFPYSAIKDFYHTWYRPSLQAIIIVGDFDLDMMESKLKALYSDIPSPKNEKQKENIIVPDFKKNSADIFTHKEITTPTMFIIQPVGLENYSTNDQMGSEIRRYMFSIISDVLNDRLSKISLKADSPFTMAEPINFSMFENNEIMGVYSSPKEGKIKESAELIAQEINRMKKYGVTSSELNRAVAALKKSNETAYNNRNDRTNTQIAFSCISNFTDNLPIIAPEMDYQIAMGLLSNINKDAVNQYVPLLFNDKNFLVTLSANEVDITEEELVKTIETGLAAEVAPIEEKVVDTNILDEKTLTPGAIIAQAEDRFGANIWTLSNGMVVVFKPTKLKKDEMIFDATLKGGLSLFEDSEYTDADLSATITTVGLNGVGKYSMTELNDALSGKDAYLSIDVNNFNTTMEGDCSSSDIETLFKLINLNITQPRFEQEDIETLRSIIKSQLSNYKSNPALVFDNEKREYTDNPLRSTSTDEMLAKIDNITAESSREVFEKVFGALRGMKFFFVGNATVEDMKRYATLYIASIPTEAEATAINRQQLNTTSVEHKFVVKQEDDKANVYIGLSSEIEENIKNVTIYNALADILRIQYTKIIREEMGATYGVSNGLSMLTTPKETIMTLVAAYATKDSHVEASSAVIIQEIEKIAKEGPTNKDFNKAIQAIKKNYTNNQIHNSYWMNILKTRYIKGYDAFTDYDKMVSKITPKDIQKAAETMLKKAVTTKVIMTSSAM